MSKSLLALIGVILIGVGLWGLISGKVIAGARGLSSNFYTKKDSPFLYYGFVFIYLSVGFFILTRLQ